MKYLQLITNPYALALNVLLALALLCLMATGIYTWLIIAIKALGFALGFLYAWLFNRWKAAGKIDIILQLFNDNDNEED